MCHASVGKNSKDNHKRLNLSQNKSYKGRQDSNCFNILLFEDKTQIKIRSEILLPLPSEVSGSSQTRPPTYTTLRKFGYFTSN